MATTIGPAGPAGQWLVEHVGYDGQDCLIWPFGRDTHGYANVQYDGKVRRGHRVMCQLANGDPPTPKHQAAHNCGNGHLACVHPRHVEWKTGSENQFDRRRHGTHGNGGVGRRGKLNPDKVRAIRAARGKVTQRELAAQYGISDATVRGVQTGRWWKHV